VLNVAVTSERGTPFTTAGFARMVERAGSEAKLGFKAHPHMLRHACGYALPNRGHDTRALQAYLGQKTKGDLGSCSRWSRRRARSSSPFSKQCHRAAKLTGTGPIQLPWNGAPSRELLVIRPNRQTGQPIRRFASGGPQLRNRHRGEP
jgi:hypothetical protein